MAISEKNQTFLLIVAPPVSNHNEGPAGCWFYVRLANQPTTKLGEVRHLFSQIASSIVVCSSYKTKWAKRINFAFENSLSHCKNCLKSCNFFSVIRRNTYVSYKKYGLIIFWCNNALLIYNLNG